MPDRDDEFIPTRRSLLSRLRDWGDDASWRRFFDTYWKLIFTTAIRAGLSDAEAQDVVQETIISVAKQMPGFKYDPARGSFKNWLRLIARRRIADHLRQAYRRPGVAGPPPEDPARTAELERLPDPSGGDLDAVWDEEWTKHLLAAAVARVKRQVDAKHFQIFDCYVLKEWPVKDVARTFGVNAGQVYLIKHRLAALLEKEIRKLEAEG